MDRNALVIGLIFLSSVGFVAFRYFASPEAVDDLSPTYRRDSGSVEDRRRGGIASFDDDDDVVGGDRADDSWGGSAAERRARSTTRGTERGRLNRDGSRDGGASGRSAQVVAGGGKSGRSGKSGKSGTIGRLAARSDAGGTNRFGRSSRSAGVGGQGQSARSDRLESLRSRGPTGGDDSQVRLDEAALRDGEVIDAAQEEEEGKLFDPFAPEVLNGEVDRGADEDALVAQGQIDVLDDGGVYVGENASYKFPAPGNVKGEEGTIDMVIVPDWNGADLSNHTLVVVGEENVWENRIKIVKNGEHIRFMHFDSEGVERSINVPIETWQAGERHQITATWDGEVTRLYLDGQFARERANEGALVFGDNTKIEVGSARVNGFGAAMAKFDDLKIGSTALPPGEF